MAKYLVKANDDVLSFCECKSSLAAGPGQLDCPWCGCGWLMSCMTCRKAFTFAQVVEVDRTYLGLMRMHFDSRGIEFTNDDLVKAATSMERLMAPLQIGKIVVYLDGLYFDVGEPNIEFEGWFATHKFERLPHAVALDGQLCTLVSENDVLQDDGQAGVQIEVTPAMIEAGVHAYWENNSDDVGSAVAVHRIFSAMLLQSKALTIRSASILNECIAAITPHPDN